MRDHSLQPGSPSPQEWSLLLEAASPHPDPNELSALTSSVNWPQTFALAESHGVIGHLAASLRSLPTNVIPPETQQALLARQRAQLFSNLKLTAELFRILELFSARGIATVNVKGPALAAQAYGDPAIRRYGDLDLLVRQQDIRLASKILISAGYDASIPLAAIDAGKTPGQYFFAKRSEGLIVELHNQHTLRYFPRPLPLESWLSHQVSVSIDGRPVPTLAPEESLVFICIHGAKHFWTQLLWVADVAALVTRQTAFDWDRVFASAQQTGSESIVCMGLQLAASLLRAALPPPIARKVQTNRSATQLAARAARWIAQGQGEAEPPGVFRRAAFRVGMRGSFFPGLAYLLRLSFSPTEDDWSSAPGDPSAASPSWLSAALRRPFRLARKHRERDE